MSVYVYTDLTWKFVGTESVRKQITCFKMKLLIHCSWQILTNTLINNNVTVTLSVNTTKAWKIPKAAASVQKIASKRWAHQSRGKKHNFDCMKVWKKPVSCLDTCPSKKNIFTSFKTTIQSRVFIGSRRFVAALFQSAACQNFDFRIIG